jgi:hypothetical protein
MSLSGNLEDVPLADVLQFIHLGRRTGTLLLIGETARAEIGFREGQIVSAWGPATDRLGAILVGQGAVDDGQLALALELQQSDHRGRSLGHVLLTSGMATQQEIRRAVESQIASTVYDLVSWRKGIFQFELDTLRQTDDIELHPGDLGAADRSQHPDVAARSDADFRRTESHGGGGGVERA